MGVKIFLAIFIFLGALNAQEFDMVDVKIINFIGEGAYNKNKSYIERVFLNKASFYRNGNVDVHKILSTLQSNGLLKLKFNKPREFNAVFSAQTSPILLLRAINESLSFMGYSYWITSEAIYEYGISKLKISLITEHIINPVTMLSELTKRGFTSIDVRVNNNDEWEYSLSLLNSQIPNSTFLVKGNSVALSNVSGEYWLTLGGRNGTLYISAQRNFNPTIVFYDKDLHILDVQTLSRRNNVNISVIDNAKFVKIKDSISSSNLRGSINVQYK